MNPFLSTVVFISFLLYACRTKSKITEVFLIEHETPEEIELMLYIFDTYNGDLIIKGWILMIHLSWKEWII